jgi:serine/threonine protein kinase
MTDLSGQSLGRYHILEPLGEGGMATVYKAYDTRLEREVAIKVIRTDIFGPAVLQRLLERFKREAHALASLTHPNIVSILDYGEHNDAPYLVMPYLPGGTLKQKLTNANVLPYQQAVRLLIPIAQALAHAHKKGILHRDVKPANILIAGTGDPLLSDFGVAKMLDSEETRELTGTGVGIGTPDYMAPEQGMGQADERADIYALGTVFYEMVTGRIPFRADTPMATLIKKREEPLPRPKQFVRDLPDSVENVLIKVLARNPANRYRTMPEFVNALEKLARGETITHKKTNGRIWAIAGIAGALVFILCAVTGIVMLTRVKNEPATAVIPLTQSPLQTGLEPASTQPVVLFTQAGLSPTLPSIPPTSTPGVFAPETHVNPLDQAEMVLIPASTFEMGLDDAQAATLRMMCQNCGDVFRASQPSHTVTLDSYLIYKTEVSNRMYNLCVQDGACNPPVRYNSETRGSYYADPKYEKYPVVFVTWYAAEKYCQWAGGHLPTEAQWEYAARGPKGNLFPWGENLPNENLANIANFLNDTTPVDEYPQGASPFGLLNLTGNVWEWVFDWYQADYYQTNNNWLNPQGPESGDYRDGDNLKSGRGGAYWIAAGNSGAGIRDWYQAGSAGSAVGFRCAQTP